MEPELLSWLLIGLPVAFALGWLGSRLDLRQLKRERDDSPRTYFKGLNLLLNEQQDQAIDAFIEAMQSDPDTTELHFALGNLFRRRGEIDRAVRVHEHLAGRGDLSPSVRMRAQRALAQDFMKAGLFDRAEAAWSALAGSTYDAEAQLALLSLYERSRGWQQAAQVARRLEGRGQGSFAGRIAHYECERAEELDAAGQPDEAAAALARAQAAAPETPRPWLLAGQRLLRQGDPAGAVRAWDALRERHGAAFVLVAGDYAACARAIGHTDAAHKVLLDALALQPAVELLQALEVLDAERPQAERIPRILAHLRAHPSLSAAQLLLPFATAIPATGPSGAAPALDEAARAALHDAVARAARPLQRYRCGSCGFEAQRHFWQCPGCLAWDSYPPQRNDLS
ncbi:MAG: lipopolysaccharide assembly protein LapB [Ideonella sp. WA131b]|jgi:lipopolysaccharide biosynthesis regulator YciM|nr:lipopolysaccharide assembly protein LapB [Ideonella sp. WA131b]